jgi:hypothetical protein
MERALSALRIVGAIVLAAIAVLGVLLVRDVHSSRNAIDQGDAVFAVAPARATWHTPTTLGGAARALLGTSDDVQYRRALQLYVEAARTPDRLDTAVERQSLRAQAARALVKASHGRHASQAQTLLGILAYGDTTGADAAISSFSNAVRADPSNAAAKFDLELLLRLSAARGSRSGAGPGGSFGPGGRRGAGGGVPGNGY